MPSFAHGSSDSISDKDDQCQSMTPTRMMLIADISQSKDEPLLSRFYHVTKEIVTKGRFKHNGLVVDLGWSTQLLKIRPIVITVGTMEDRE